MFHTTLLVGARAAVSLLPNRQTDVERGLLQAGAAGAHRVVCSCWTGVRELGALSGPKLDPSFHLCNAASSRTSRDPFACGRSLLRPLTASASLVDHANRDLPDQTSGLPHHALDTRLCAAFSMLRLLESYIMRYGGSSAISVAAADKPHWLLPRELSVISTTRNMQTLDKHPFITSSEGALE
jgi:hypothetical protein